MCVCARECVCLCCLLVGLRFLCGSSRALGRGCVFLGGFQLIKLVQSHVIGHPRRLNQFLANYARNLFRMPLHVSRLFLPSQSGITNLAGEHFAVLVVREHVAGQRSFTHFQATFWASDQLTPFEIFLACVSDVLLHVVSRSEFLTAMRAYRGRFVFQFPL
jgi:hypothetical protein